MFIETYIGSPIWNIYRKSYMTLDKFVRSNIGHIICRYCTSSFSHLMIKVCKKKKNIMSYIEFQCSSRHLTLYGIVRLNQGQLLYSDLHTSTMHVMASWGLMKWFRVNDQTQITGYHFGQRSHELIQIMTDIIFKISCVKLRFLVLSYLNEWLLWINVMQWHGRLRTKWQTKSQMEELAFNTIVPRSGDEKQFTCYADHWS